MRAFVGDESLTSLRGAAPRVQLGAMATGCEGLGGGITGAMQAGGWGVERGTNPRERGVEGNEQAHVPMF